MDKDFLLHLYETEKIPKFLFKIIKENTEKYPEPLNHTSITTNNSFYSNNQLNKIYKRNQYEYQKNNIDWMIQQEYNINLILNYIIHLNYLQIIIYILFLILMLN